MTEERRMQRAAELWVWAEGEVRDANGDLVNQEPSADPATDEGESE